MKHSAIQQFNYHAWSNHRVFDHLNSLPGDLYTREVESVFPTLQDVLVHLYQVDTMWLSVMSGDSFKKTMALIKQHEEKSKGRPLDELRNLFGEAEQSYASFFDQLDDPDAGISINHPRYGSLETTVSELVHHVVNHGTYHRGNITAMLRQMGHSGVPTDYVFYLYELNQPEDIEAPDGL